MAAIHSDLVPDELKVIDRWLVWRQVPKPGGGFDKRPLEKGWNAKRQSFDDAMQRAIGNRGIGFYFSGEDDIGAVDLDCVRDPQTGEIVDWAREVLAAFGPTYVEVSPSGTGLKLFAHGCPVSGKARADMPGEAAGGHRSPALEVFATIGYSTVTGNRLPGAPSSLATALEAKAGWDVIFSNWIKPRRRNEDDDDGERVDWDMMDAGALAFLLEGLDVCRHDSQPDWFSILCASHFVTGGDEDACEVFVEWSAGNPQYGHKSRRVRRKWHVLKKGSGNHGAPTLIRHLRNDGRDDLADGLKQLLEECEAEADEAFGQWQDEHSDMPTDWEPAQ